MFFANLKATVSLMIVFGKYRVAHCENVFCRFFYLNNRLEYFTSTPNYIDRYVTTQFKLNLVSYKLTLVSTLVVVVVDI